jgi:2-C-methyl-D-erythritol 4-phosphate cytidylyltransferase
VADVWAIVLAAGTGARFGGCKQFACLDGRPLVDWVVDTAVAAGCRTVVVVPPGDGIPVGLDVEYSFTSDGDRWVVKGADVVGEGGATRADSVRAGLTVVPDGCDVVVVAEAARPLASVDLWCTVIASVRAGAAAVTPVVSLVDSVRWADGPPVDRMLLRAVQTPQAFNASALRDRHRTRPECTDDAGLFDDVVMVNGEVSNVKVTHPGDLAVVEALHGRLVCRSRS